MITPGQPVEVAVTDGSPEVLLRVLPVVEHVGCCGMVVGSLVSGSRPTKTPWPARRQSGRSPTDSADWLNDVSGGFQPDSETSRDHDLGTVTVNVPSSSVNVTSP